MEYEFGLKAKEWKIITSGTFLTFDEGPYELFIKRGDEITTLNFFFIDDDGKESAIERTSSKDNVKNHLTINFNFLNMGGVLGTGLKKPIEFMRFDNGDQAFLNVLIRKSGSKDSEVREVTYTIYVAGAQHDASE
jgi:hypothetical protein